MTATGKLFRKIELPGQSSAAAAAFDKLREQFEVLSSKFEVLSSWFLEFEVLHRELLPKRSVLPKQSVLP